MTRRGTVRTGTAIVLAVVLPLSGCAVFDSGETPLAKRAWEYTDAKGDDPTVYEQGGRLLMYAGDELTALSVESGEELWTVDDIAGDVHVTEEAAIVRGGGHRTVDAVDLRTGERRELAETDQEEGFDNIAVAGDTLFTHEPDPDRAMARRLVARELSTGDERWRRDIDHSLGDRFGRKLAVHAPIAVHQPFEVDAEEPKDIVATASNASVVYASNADWDGTATVSVALDVDTGDIIETLPQPLLDLEHLKPLLTEDGVRITERFLDEKCRYTVDVNDGEDARTMEFGAYSAIDLDECVESVRAPWISGKHLCGADENGRAQLVDWTTGETIWREPKTVGEVFGCTGTVVVRFGEGFKQGSVNGVDVRTGERLWQRDAGDDEGRYSRVVHDGLLIDAGRTNAIAVDPATGDRVWKVLATTGEHVGILGVGSGRVYLYAAGDLLAVDTP